jgi:signal transduction histidine kinase/CheY-like chemotaxis protein/HAMP domain-containing protein
MADVSPNPRAKRGVRAWLRRLPLRTKLTVTILSVTGVALGACLASILLLNVDRLESAMARRIDATTQLIGEYSISPLTFEDAPGATEILSKLDSDPEIQAVVLFDERGKRFAAFERSRDTRARASRCAPAPGLRFEHEALVVVRTIEQKGALLGSVCIEASTAQLSASIASATRWFGAVWLGLMALAYGLTAALQSWIREPILHLGRATREVAERADYSLRVEQFGEDEIGGLVQQFNGMLQTLEVREEERNAARQELSQRLRWESALAGFARSLLNPTSTAEDRVHSALLSLNAAFAIDGVRVFEVVPSAEHGLSMKVVHDLHAAEAASANAATRLIPFEPALAAWQAELGAGHLIAQSAPRNAAEREALGPAAKGAFLLVPLYLSGQWYGQVAFVRERAAAWSEDEVELLHTAATMLATYLGKSRNEEELLRARNLKSLGVLAGGIAHDFNNLLTGILGNLSLAKALGSPASELNTLLEEAEGAARRATDLTRQLLTFSRGGAPIKKPTSVGGLVRETAEFALRGSGASPRFTIPNDLWAAEVDENQVSQMVHNLVLNAAQAMRHSGQVEVTLENRWVREGDGLPLPPGRYVYLEVADRGCGIPADALPNIFDPYFTTKQSGTGLGLAVVFSIVQRHRGHIGVESRPDLGTRFRVHLPAATRNTQGERAAVEERTAEALKGSRPKALVLDDEDAVLAVARGMLERTGFEVATVSRGEDLLSAYAAALHERRPYDVVIMDLTIRGGMGGGECMPKLREMDPNVTAIVSSGYSNDAIMQRPRDFGFVGVLAKPYEFKHFREVMLTIIQEHGR